MHLSAPAPRLAREHSAVLDFVWLELTNRCNLRCVHCYAESAPTSGDDDVLDEEDYLALIEQIHGLGCRKLQFIGGEPTLNRSLPRLIAAAHARRFEFIEVFTNLTRISDTLLDTFRRFRVAVATSFYSHRPETHDGITGQPGSFDRTVRNMRRVLAAGLRLRVGVIEMDQNRADLAATRAFLETLGVQSIGGDRLRKIGRAADGFASDMRELCGSCAGNILTIGPDGLVAPCNMSKQWTVGSVLEQSLEEIVASPALSRVRTEIGASAVRSTGDHGAAICDPKTCGPYSFCCPSTQQCFPCAPNGCTPCYPNG
jgi:MoaA/NifB/PqqE/SkfB family radical SAM enzyme